jgi:translocation and assembly module TamA
MFSRALSFALLRLFMGVFAARGLPAEALPANDSLNYEIRWEGLKKHAMAELLKKTSRMETLKNAPPASMPLLQKRLDQDIVRLLELLQAQGYYEAKLSGKIEATQSPATVILNCQPGPLFYIGEIDIVYPDHQRPLSVWKPLLQSTDPATTGLVRSEEARILRYLQQNGHPEPLISNRDYVVDPEKKTMDLRYEVDPGAPRRFGNLTTVGVKSLNPKYIRRQKPWEDGDWYDIRLIEDFEKDLVLTGLFSRVRISIGPGTTDPETLDLLLTVTERYPRTIRAGANYRSDVGFGANSSWEHRNVFGRGERLKIEGLLAEEERWLSAGIRKPGFITNNQSILLNFSVRDEQPDAYSSRSYNTSIGVERTFSRSFSSSLGLGYKYASVKQGGEENIYGLVYLPWKMKWDSTQSDLNPVAGHRTYTELTPYTDLLNGDLDFTRIEFSDSRYFRLTRRPQLILAARVTAGTLLGAESSNIPADERYYAGGGGSVRGYSYQSIGPSVDGESVGGSALLESSFELRARFTETWGVATFLDGGMVSNGKIPDQNFPMKWGAGAGLRIFTGIGPLRLDVAYPLNPDPDKTAQVQFYISLGQAF